MPNTTVVLPTYNEAENLPLMVDALLALPVNLRILIVDDNSPDGTGNLADDLASADADTDHGAPPRRKSRSGSRLSSPDFNRRLIRRGLHHPDGRRFLAPAQVHPRPDRQAGRGQRSRHRVALRARRRCRSIVGPLPQTAKLVRQWRLRAHRCWGFPSRTRQAVIASGGAKR